MRIGILGGSFDPPHLGHLLVARQTKEIMNLDQVWLMPYFAHNWDIAVSSAKDRLSMVKLIEEEGIAISEEEIKQKEKNYTIDTVRWLKQKYPHKFFWILGSDLLKEFYKWKENEQLTKEIPILVFPRDGYPILSILPPEFNAIISSNLVTSNISSTLVRHRLVKNLSVAGLIPEPVLLYIKKHRLYETR